MAFVQPQDGRGQLAPKVCRDEDDPDVGGDVGLLVIRVARVQKTHELASSIDLRAAPIPGKVRGVGTDDVPERHRGDHCRVAESLEVHMAAVLGPLEFDDHELPCLVDGEQVDPAARVLPLAELLRDDQQVVAEHVDVIANETLHVGPFVQAKVSERRRSMAHQARLVDLVERHLAQRPSGNRVIRHSAHLGDRADADSTLFSVTFSFLGVAPCDA